MQIEECKLENANLTPPPPYIMQIGKCKIENEKWK